MKNKDGQRIGHRVTKAEQALRVTEIHRLLLMQVPRHDILRFVAEKTTWNIAKRSVEYLITKATRLIQQSASVDRELELGLAITQVKDLYGKSVRIQDYKGALSCRKELSELLGLYPAKRMELTGEDSRPMQFIALMPTGPKDRDEWSRQCRQEAAAREQQRQAEPAIGQQAGRS